jgi:pimeloyl-ACP methyl ester carboxylesterase
LARAERVKGLILIAPAPDFTEGVLDEIPEEGRRAILETGRWDMPSPYDPKPTPITQALIEDGKRNLLLHAPIPFQGPVHILQGMRDPDVPWATALKVIERLENPNAALTLIKDGDHRLSRPQDLARLLDVTERFLSAL